jgi:hypothetical protein
VFFKALPSAQERIALLKHPEISTILTQSCGSQMVLMIIFSVLAGIIELPLCCTCFQCCRAIGDKMIYFKHFLMRALMYATFAASLIAVQVVQENNSAGWVLGILNGINAILYVIAHCTGETPGDEAAEEGVARWALHK